MKDGSERGIKRRRAEGAPRKERSFKREKTKSEKKSTDPTRDNETARAEHKSALERAESTERKEQQSKKRSARKNVSERTEQESLGKKWKPLDEERHGGEIEGPSKETVDERSSLTSKNQERSNGNSFLSSLPPGGVLMYPSADGSFVVLPAPPLHTIQSQVSMAINCRESMSGKQLYVAEAWCVPHLSEMQDVRCGWRVCAIISVHKVFSVTILSANAHVAVPSPSRNEQSCSLTT